MSHHAMKKFVVTPHSFGGFRREEGKEIAAVPAAINEVLKAIENGARFVMSADISRFFTRISKSTVRGIVLWRRSDDEFMALFDEAIKVELANLAELREKAEMFPIEDIALPKETRSRHCSVTFSFMNSTE